MLLYINLGYPLTLPPRRITTHNRIVWGLFGNDRTGADYYTFADAFAIMEDDGTSPIYTSEQICSGVEGLLPCLLIGISKLKPYFV